MMLGETNLLNQVRHVIRGRNYSDKTEIAYLDWIYRFLFFHNKRSPKEIGTQGISEFLNFLATKKKVSASTQNQAFNAISFLYRNVLNIELSDLNFNHIKAKRRFPVILNQLEIKRILAELNGEANLMASLLYGSGLHLSECLSLRIRDIDFDQNRICITEDRTQKNRKTILPTSLRQKIKNQISHAKWMYEHCISDKHFIGVSLPDTVKQKYPNAFKKLEWQYLFPSKKHNMDPLSGTFIQQHHDVSFLQKEVKKAILKAGITYKKVSCRTFRHSFAAHLLENGCPIKIVQKLLGHKNTRTTMIYNHVLHTDEQKIKSPLDI